MIDLSLACAETRDFCVGKTLVDFRSDRLLQLAVERQFEIIGEALVRLERTDAINLAKRIPEYRKIIGFRNVIAHGYDQIDDVVLWDFVVNRVPELLQQVEKY